MKPTSDTETVASVENAETLMVPVTVHPVLAYNVVNSRSVRQCCYKNLESRSSARSQVARMDIITQLDEALGAIAKHDIPAGRFLRRSDLLNGPLVNRYLPRI